MRRAPARASRGDSGRTRHGSNPSGSGKLLQPTRERASFFRGESCDTFMRIKCAQATPRSRSRLRPPPHRAYGSAHLLPRFGGHRPSDRDAERGACTMNGAHKDSLLSNDPKIVAQQLKQREFAVAILSSSEVQSGMKAFREVRGASCRKPLTALDRHGRRRDCAPRRLPCVPRSQKIRHSHLPKLQKGSRSARPRTQHGVQCRGQSQGRPAIRSAQLGGQQQRPTAH